jgi:hypothetical protein
LVGDSRKKKGEEKARRTKVRGGEEKRRDMGWGRDGSKERSYLVKVPNTISFFT